MTHTLLALLSAVAVISLLGGCNPDVFVSDESKHSASFTVSTGDSVAVSIKTDDLRSVTIEFGSRVQMCFYDSDGVMFDRSYDSDYTFKNQFRRLSRATFSYGLFYATATVDASTGRLTVSAASNMGADDVTMTIKLGYGYSTRVLTYDFPSSPLGAYEVEDIVYGTLMEGYGNNLTLIVDYVNSADTACTYTFTPFASLMRSVWFTLDAPYDKLSVTIPTGMRVALPSLPPLGQSGSIGMWGDSMELKWGLSMLPSNLQKRSVSLTVPPLTKTLATIKIDDICIYADVVFNCSSEALPGRIFPMKGRMWVYDDSFYTITTQNTPVQPQ